jgi:hypothetical protein
MSNFSVTTLPEQVKLECQEMILMSALHYTKGGCRGHMVVGYTTTYAISAHHH